MDYYSSDNYENSESRPPKPTTSRAMETTAMVLGIISVATIFFIYVPLVCGPLAIILANLSRGAQPTFTPKGKVAVGLGIAGFVFAIILVVFSFIIVMNTFGGVEGFVDYYNSVMQQYFEGTGIDPSEYMLELSAVFV